MIKKFGDFINFGVEEHYKQFEKCPPNRESDNPEFKKILDEMSDEELENLWVDYRTIVKPISFDNPVNIWVRLYVDFDAISATNEGLIKTYPIDRTIKYVKECFNLDDRQIYSQVKRNEVKYIFIEIPNFNDNINVISVAMDACGYYLGWPPENERKKNRWVTLQFEPKFIVDSSIRIRREEKILYHITPYYNLEKIKKFGFSPRNKNTYFYYPGRVYFLRGSTDREIIELLGNELSSKNFSKGNVEGKYAIITVDLEKIPEDVRFSLDTNYEWGIFTPDNIRPDCIIDAEEVYFDTPNHN